MEIANGFVCTSPENVHMVYGITPAEAVIIKAMHNQYSNGSPLRDLKIVGEAKEVDQHGKHKVNERHHIATRKIEKRVAGKKVVEEYDEPAVEYSHSEKPRTNEEEINRLKRKYTGNVPKSGGGTQPAFVAAFGEGVFIKLPETFEEVKSTIGSVFTDARPKTVETATA